jgi:hypothetical protein
MVKMKKGFFFLGFDKEVLNEIRDCWLDRVGMRI